MINFWEEDKFHDECGVFGVYAPGRQVARLAFFGLYALQHRGQESAGIATCDGRSAYSHKGMGLVSQVFNEENLRPLQGHLAIGQNRYSTTGSSHLRNAQPYLIETIYGPLGVAHNGNLTNALHLRHQLLKRGVGLSSTSDSEVITQMLAAPAEVWAQPLLNGAEPTAGWPGCGLHAGGRRGLLPDLMTREAIYAVRDPLGLRPLCLGQLENGGYVVASETCALHTIGAEFRREVQPGEIVRLDQHGVTSFHGADIERRALCIFEYVYFARPDSLFEGQSIHDVRQQLGRQLAREAPAEADMVVGVPDSATPAAIGYSLESGLPYTEGLTKNRYIGRTFIQPDDQLRKEGVRIKYNPLSANLAGKRVVMIDDSIVRGNTAGPLVQLCATAGPKRSTCASARRRCAIPALWASTWPPGSSSSPTTGRGRDSPAHWGRQPGLFESGGDGNGRSFSYPTTGRPLHRLLLRPIPHSHPALALQRRAGPGES
jgi:amidophosphoribosyltransferase